MRRTKQRTKKRPERLVCYVPPTLKREAEEAAADFGVSTSTFVGLALRAFLKPAASRRRAAS